VADAEVINGVAVERRGAVGWIILEDYQETAEASVRSSAPYVHPSTGVALALDELRYDPDVRVVVLTGRNDGEFYRVCRAAHYDDLDNRARLDPLRRGGYAPLATARNPMQLLALIEKPVVARVNGDAIGLGQALLWGCDIVVAREDAVIADVHTGQQEVVDSAGEVRGFPWAVTPGDGALSFAPLYLPPTKLKEYLFLSRAWTARQLAELGVVNHAVPAGELDSVVDEVVAGLLARPGAVLAHIKKVVNKRLVEQWNLTQDLAQAYELLDFWDHAVAGNMR
jgi:enoyl-CoA hydratase